MTKKIKTDLIINYISLIILAVCGLLFHILIAARYGANSLGIFNLSMAIYVVASQISIMGIQNALLHHAAINTQDAPKYLTSALLFTLPIATTISVILYVSIPLLSKVFNNVDLNLSLPWITLGLFFFSLNKVFLSYLNGIEKMKLYAMLQSTRHLSVLLCILIFPKLHLSASELTASFFISELLVFIISICVLFSHILSGLAFISMERIKKLIHFGSRSFLSGTFLELNVRIDILIIGYLLNSYWVGVYSFAATFAEGFLQFFIVIKNQLNPHMSQLISQNKAQILKEKIVIWRRNTYLFTLFIGICIYAFCALYIHFMNLSSDFQHSLTILAVLLAGIWASSGSHTFDTLLLYGGHPLSYTMYIFWMLVTNLFLNFLFIPTVGAVGAAIATIMSYFLGAFVMQKYVQQKLNIKFFEV